MLIYLIKYRSFQGILSNIANAYNEAIVLILYVFLIITKFVPMNSNKIEIFGWTILSLIFVSFILTWVMMISDIKQSSAPPIEKKKSTTSRNMTQIKTNPRIYGNMKIIKSSLKSNKPSPLTNFQGRTKNISIPIKDKKKEEICESSIKKPKSSKSFKLPSNKL